MGKPPTHRRWRRIVVVALLLAAATAEPVTAAPLHAETTHQNRTAAAQVFTAQGPTDDIVGTTDGDRRWLHSDRIQYGFQTSRGDFDYVGTVYVYAELEILRGRRVLWSQTIRQDDGPPIQARVRWNCVDDNGSWPSSSCSGGWREATSDGYSTDGFGRWARYHLRDDDIYWFEFTYEWREWLGVAGREMVFRSVNQVSTWHFKCERSRCWFDPNNPHPT